MFYSISGYKDKDFERIGYPALGTYTAKGQEVRDMAKSKATGMGSDTGIELGCNYL